MKRKIIPVVAAVTLLCSCGNGAQVKKDEINSVSESFTEDFEKCRQTKYVNLDFSECTGRLPTFDSCVTIKVYLSSDEAYTNSDMYARLEGYCEQFFGEYDEAMSVFDSFDVENKYEWEPEYPNYGYKTRFSEYKQDILSDKLDINSLIYRDIENCKYLWWIKGDPFPYWINKGEAFAVTAEEHQRVTSWVPSDMDTEQLRIFNGSTDMDKEYDLFEGLTSIGEAVDYFENEYLDSIGLDVDEKYSLDVSGIGIFEVGDKYGYLMYFSPAYNGIPFDTTEEYVSSQATMKYSVMDEALMIRKDDVDTIVGLSFPRVEETGEITDKIISLTDAVDIMSDKLTDQIKFEVQSVEFVYSGDMSEDYTTAYLSPNWKFTALNRNDSHIYCVYVNAINGSFSYNTKVWNG